MRDLLRLGLAAEGFKVSMQRRASRGFGALDEEPDSARKGNGSD